MSRVYVGKNGSGARESRAGTRIKCRLCTEAGICGSRFLCNIIEEHIITNYDSTSRIGKELASFRMYMCESV